MKTLGATLLAQGAAEAHGPVWLAEVAAWNGVTVRWANSDDDVVYGGNTYAARPLGLAAVEAGGEGAAREVELSVANHDLAVSALCAAAEPVGCAVTLRRTFLGALTAAQTLLSGVVVSGYGLTEEAATFRLAPGDTALRRQVPGRLASRTCPWVFKGAECTYAGADATCKHTDEDCAARTGGSNLLNFGGFLFTIPRQW